MHARHAVDIILRNEAHQLPNASQAVFVVSCEKLRYAADGIVSIRASKIFLRHVFVSDGFDDVGACHKHVTGFVDHKNKIGERGRIHSTAGARPHNGGDLRNNSARESVAQKDIRVTGQRDNALLDPRASRIVQADDRRAGFQRQIHDFHDFLRV